MPLFLIGLGLADFEDVSLRGDRLIKDSHLVWLENYTSVFPNTSTQDFARRYPNVPIQVADRNVIESEFGGILESAKTKNVSVLVIGDPFSATTHADLYLRARKEGVEIRVVHNASIMNAAGCCGLSLYTFGQTVSIPLFQGTWRPYSFYDRLRANHEEGSHTLCLLDIKVKEPNIEILTTRGKVVYDPPYFMTIKEAIAQIMEADAAKSGAGGGYFSLEKTMGVGLMRVGSESQKIVYGTLGRLLEYDDYGGPLHSLVIPGKMHQMELEMLSYFQI